MSVNRLPAAAPLDLGAALSAVPSLPPMPPHLPSRDAASRPPAPPSASPAANPAHASPSLNAPPRGPMPGTDASAFEELTFQHSETREAEAHEEARDHTVLQQERVQEAQAVQRVTYLLNLMAGGKDAARHLRQRATEFMRQWPSDPQAALRLLEPSAYPPDQRSGVASMALGLLGTVKAHDHPQARALLERLQQEGVVDERVVGALMRKAQAEADLQARSGAAAVQPRSPLMQTLQSPPTARDVFETYGTDPTDRLTADIQSVQRQGRFSVTGVEIGMAVSLSRWMSVVRSVNDQSDKLLRTASPEAPKPEAVTQVSRTLIEATATHTPGAQLDRLRKNLCKDPKSSMPVLTTMMRTVMELPHCLWHSADAKQQARDTLRRALTEGRTHSGLRAAFETRSVRPAADGARAA